MTANIDHTHLPISTLDLPLWLLSFHLLPIDHCRWGKPTLGTDQHIVTAQSDGLVCNKNQRSSNTRTFTLPKRTDDFISALRRLQSEHCGFDRLAYATFNLSWQGSHTGRKSVAMLLGLAQSFHGSIRHSEQMKFSITPCLCKTHANSYEEKNICNQHSPSDTTTGYELGRGCRSFVFHLLHHG